MGNYAKMIVAVIGAALVALQVALGDGSVSPQDYVAIAIAGFAALGVGAVPNAARSEAYTGKHRPTDG